MKVRDFVSVALFSVDVRKEVGDTVTIVGVIPDNVTAVSQNSVIPKLVIYVRSLVAMTDKPLSKMIIRFVSPSEDVLAEQTIDEDEMNRITEVFREQESPVATILSEFTIQNFSLKDVGRYFVTSEYNGKEYLAGHLKVKQAKAANSKDAQN